MSSGPRTQALATVGLLLFLAVVQADDGGGLYKAKACDSCHGERGSHPLTPDYPTLAGQNAKYLLRQMRDIRDGRRDNGLSAEMRAAVAEVSDGDFAVIAEWLARQF